MYNIHMRTLIILIIYSLLISCSTVVKKSSEEITMELKKSAAQSMLSEQYLDAAKQYLILIEKDKENANSYRLQAATAYIKANSLKEAGDLLNKTSFPENDLLQNTKLSILKANLALKLDKSHESIELLSKVSSLTSLPLETQLTYHDIKSKAYLKHNDFLNAALERLKITELINEPVSRYENNRVLWDILETIPKHELNELRLSAPEKLISWLELLSIYEEHRFKPKDLKKHIDGWELHYPEHIALNTIIPELLKKSDELVDKPNKIGLLLPFDDKHKKISTAIRDGFITAWYFDNNKGAEIEIYHANKSNIIDVYNKAIGNGVNYIVGPLEKEAVQKLMGLNEQTIRILALNRQNGLKRVNNKLYQFALSPEDEASQIAEMAISDGHHLALIVTPNNKWGQRIADSFKKSWVELGGGVLEEVYYDQNLKDASIPIKEILNIDSSKVRAAIIKNKINIPFHSVERRRQDIDMIFIATNPKNANQLVPQIRYYNAENLPIYSTSHIFNGITEDTNNDSEINGIIFIDMPWVIDSSHQLSIIQDALNRNWDQNKSNYRRLYAIGIDAYHLIPELERLSKEKNSYFDGKTGNISVDANNIIRRELQPAQFIEGKPILIH